MTRVLSSYSGSVDKPTPIPPFTVREVEGPFTREFVSFDTDERKLVKKTEEVDTAFFVYFQKGHTLVFYSKDELDLAGFGERVSLPSNGVVESFGE